MRTILIDLMDFDLQKFLKHKDKILSYDFDGFILVRVYGVTIPQELSEVLMNDAANGRGTVFACDRMRHRSLLEASAEDATTLKDFLERFDASFIKINSILSRYTN